MGNNDFAACLPQSHHVDGDRDGILLVGRYADYGGAASMIDGSDHRKELAEIPGKMDDRNDIGVFCRQFG
jgi:hypothetical protein